jgi:hypothetical protein
MAKAIDSSKQILAGLLIFSFLLVILVATRSMKQDDTKESEKSKEGFVSTAPTRASECRCLPGYVPSKEELAMEFLLDPRGWGFLQVGNRVYGYWWNMHGIQFDWRNTKYRWVSNDYLAKLSMGSGNRMWFSGNQYDSDTWASKEMVEKALRQQRDGKKELDVYRCQNLNNPTDLKECY